MKLTTQLPFIDFGSIKEAVSLRRVLEHYGLFETFTVSGDEESLRGPCPIHGGHNPKQFSVSLTKNCWNCFADCGGGGNVLDFVAQMEDTDVHHAAVLLNDWFGLGLSRPRPKRAARQGHRPQRGVTPSRNAVKGGAGEAPVGSAEAESPGTNPDGGDAGAGTSSASDGPVPGGWEDEGDGDNPPLGFVLKDLDRQHPYFDERGLDESTVAEFGLGFCGRGTMSGRIAVPLHNGTGDLVGYVGRLPGEPSDGRPKYKFPKGFRKSVEVFNLHRAAAEEDDLPLVVVEGVFDCLHLWQLGYRRCVALMGCQPSERQCELLEMALPDSRFVMVLLDDDEAGQAGRDILVARLVLRAFVKAPRLPSGCRQPDELGFDDLRLLDLV